MVFFFRGYFVNIVLRVLFIWMEGKFLFLEEEEEEEGEGDFIRVIFYY